MLSVLPGTEIDVTGDIPTVCHLTDGNITDWLGTNVVAGVIKSFSNHDSRHTSIVLIYGEAEGF
jgi:hypothetical protein